MTHFFTSAEVWTGGFYQLAIELGPTDDRRLTSALECVWLLDGLEGCYLDSSREPADQPRTTFGAALRDHGHLQGLARLPNGNRVACGTCETREMDGPDWLIFYVPLGALKQAYPVEGFPFDRGVDHESWRAPLDAWLVDIGRRVFARAPFRLALIGFEASGAHYADEITASGIPEERFFGFLVPDGPKLAYFPRTESET